MPKSSQPPRRPHDPVYRRIFSNPGIIEQALRRFLKAPWLGKLDFSTLELVPTRYVSRFLEQRESDIVWRVRYGNGEQDWFFVYVLMELQSSVQRFMALRLWAYIALFYQYLLRQKLLTPLRLLPPVLPIVLYNGEKPWSAPLVLADLIQPVEGLERPSFEYVVLDASHHPVEELRPVEDVVSGVFLMEQVENFADLETVLDELEGLVTDPELEKDISLLVSSVVGKLALSGETVPRLRTLQEVRNMLAERVARWPKQWLEQGLEQGRQEGLRTGKAEILTDLASRRFGELPQWVMERFGRADVDTLDRWSSRLLDAERLEDVFGDK
jgi:predicted transposase/invertase (TIGR01784 family)